MSNVTMNSVSTSNNVIFSVSEKNDNLDYNKNMGMRMMTRSQMKSRKYSEEEMEVVEFITNMAQDGRFNARIKNSKDYSIYFEDICPETERVLAKEERNDEDYIPCCDVDGDDENNDMAKTVTDMEFAWDNEVDSRDSDEDYIPECDEDFDDEEDDDTLYFENVFIHDNSKYYNMKMEFENEHDDEYQPDTDHDYTEEDDDALYFENVDMELQKEKVTYEDSDESSDYEYHSEDDTEHEFDYSGDEDEEDELVEEFVEQTEKNVVVHPERGRTYSIEDDYDTSSDYAPSDDE